MRSRSDSFWACIKRMGLGIRARRSVRHRPIGAAVWAVRVSPPVVRFFTDPFDDEFVIERQILAVELARRLEEAGSDMRPELRELMHAWSDANLDPLQPVADLPYRWRSFGTIAMDLIEKRHGYCYCRECQKIYSAAEMTVLRSKVGTEYVTYTTSAKCPQLHTVMQLQAHLRMRV